MTIFTTAGVPIDRDWWHGVTLGIAERKAANRPMLLAADATGAPVFKVVRDILGDPRSVYRGLPLSGRYWHSKYSGEELRMLRARNGVGRPVEVSEPDYDLGPPYWAAVQEHGSQRKAALALGLNLSTFQRRLAKEAA